MTFKHALDTELEEILEKDPARPMWLEVSYDSVYDYFFKEGGTHESFKQRLRYWTSEGVYMCFGKAYTDMHLLRYILTLSDQGKINNYFIEAGANNGVLQSNTCLLEWGLGWEGVLIEPSKFNAAFCTLYRSNSQVWNCALVSDDYKELHIAGTWDDCVLENRSMNNGLGSGCTVEHLSSNPEFISSVPAKTLTAVLEESNAPKDIGVLSLDVEGYEMEALLGLDFNKFQPKLILLEITPEKDEKIYHDFLSGVGYKLINNITDQDYLYVREEN